MKFFFFIFAFLYFDFSYADLNTKYKRIFKRTQRFQLYELKEREILSGVETQQSPIPVKWDTSVSRTSPYYHDKSETARLTGSLREYTDSFVTTLVYNDFSSLKNTFRTEYSVQQFDTAYSNLEYQKNYDISNRLEYNITNNGINSSLKINQEIELKNFSIAQLNNIKILNSDFIDFNQQLLSFLLLGCKIKNQSKLKAIVDNTLKKGRILFDIKAISRKDFLNYKNQQIDLERTLLNLKREYIQAQLVLETYGIKQRHIDIRQFKDLCDENVTIKSRNPKTDSYLSGNIEIEIVKKQLELAGLQLKASQRSTVANVFPFFELGVNTSVDQNAQDYRVVAGINIGWEITNTRQRSNVKFKNDGMKYSEGDYKLSIQRIQSQDSSLRQDLKFLAQLIDIQKKSLNQNAQLLKILRLEQSIKKGDSFNFANTVSSQINLINNFYDLIQQIELKKNQLAIINDGKYLLR